MFYVLPCVILFLCVSNPFSIAITWLGEERASRGTFRTFVRFALVWFCLFLVPFVDTSLLPVRIPKVTSGDIIASNFINESATTDCKTSVMTAEENKQYLDDDDDDEFRFNDALTHEGHLRQNGELTWFCNETIIMISHKCIKCKTRTNLKIKAVILC